MAYKHQIDAQQYSTGMTALMHASEMGYINIVQVLADLGANINLQDTLNYYSALTYAIKRRRHAIIQILLDKGADINITDYSRINIATHAIISNNDTIIDLVFSKVDISAITNIYEWYSMYYYAIRLHCDVSLEFLLRINSTNSQDIINIQNLDDGRTLLMDSIETLDYTIINMLIQNGADINKHDNSFTTPLMYAIKNDMISLVELFVANGADVNRQDKKGMTALMYFVQKYYHDKSVYNTYINYLVKNDFTLEIRNTNRDTALSIVVQKYDEYMIRLLLSLYKNNVNKQIAIKDVAYDIKNIDLKRKFLSIDV
jgi:serine/threonine-protein phosphatase 6 regulatory ankyrin repeat subunit B